MHQGFVRAPPSASRSVKVRRNQVPRPIRSRPLPPGRRFHSHDAFEDSREDPPIDPGESQHRIDELEQRLRHVAHAGGTDQDGGVADAQFVGRAFDVDNRPVGVERDEVRSRARAHVELTLAVVARNGHGPDLPSCRDLRIGVRDQGSDEFLHEWNVRFDDDRRRRHLNQPCQSLDRIVGGGLGVEVLQQHAAAVEPAYRVLQQRADHGLGHLLVRLDRRFGADLAPPRREKGLLIDVRRRRPGLLIRVVVVRRLRVSGGRFPFRPQLRVRGRLDANQFGDRLVIDHLHRSFARHGEDRGPSMDAVDDRGAEQKPCALFGGVGPERTDAGPRRLKILPHRLRLRVAARRGGAQDGLVGEVGGRQLVFRLDDAEGLVVRAQEVAKEPQVVGRRHRG